jgi:hypothetical protein
MLLLLVVVGIFAATTRASSQGIEAYRQPSGVADRGRATAEIFSAEGFPRKSCDTQLNPGEDIGRDIERALGDGKTICLGGGTFKMGAGQDGIGVRITGVSDVRIVGSGYYTSIVMDSSVRKGFQIEGQVRSLEISNLRIQGSADATNEPRRHTVAINSEPNNGRGNMSVRGVTLRDLDISNVNVAVVISGGINNGEVVFEYDDVLITRNVIHDILGSAPGFGYGIATEFATNVRLLHNEIRNAHRHAIYVVGGSGAMIIANNLILDHARGAVDSANNRWSSAISVARSSHVTVLTNRIVNSRNMALSAELDDRHGKMGDPDYDPNPMVNIHLIGNQIVGTEPAESYDIWVNRDSTTRVVLWGNRIQTLLCTFNGAQPSYVGKGYVVPGVDPVLDREECALPYVELEPSRWTGTQAITTSAGDIEHERIYVMRRDSLHAVDVAYGEHPNAWPGTVSPIKWSGFQALSAMNGHVYVMRQNVLHEVDHPWGRSYRASTGWSDFRAMTAFQGYNRVFVVKGDEIYSVNPADWSITSSAVIDWSTTSAMVRGALLGGFQGSYLFILNGNNIYKMNPRNMYAEPN